MDERRFRPDGYLACRLSFHQRIAIAADDDDGDDVSGGLNTNARAIYFFLTLLLFLRSFFCSFPHRPLSPSLLFPYGGHTSPRRETTMSTTGGKEENERTQVKDDCMSNLRHGDYDYITFVPRPFSLSLLSSHNQHLIQCEGQGYFFDVCA